MAISLKNALPILLAVAIIMTGCKRSPVTASNDPDPAAYLDKPIVIGHGIGDIEIQNTTLSQATARLGTKFKRAESEGSFGSKCVDGVCDNNFQKFTDIRLDYSDYGIMLGFRAIEGDSTPESELKIRFIYITCVPKANGCAFTGSADGGIHLGSTRKEVISSMGPSDTWTGRQGIICKKSGVNIRFKGEYLRIGDDDTVESFEIFSPANFNEFEHRSV